MKCPTLIRAIEADLAAGRAPVVQLVSTGEALLDRRLAELPPSEHADLSIDLTPREYIMEYLVRAFPTTLHEETVNDEGKVIAVPVRDEDGRPVESQEAVEARDLLIAELGALPAMPSAIDILMHRFGHDEIAEVTGRSRRVLALPAPNGGTRHAVSSRAPSANLSEAAAFMDGTKKVLIFSTAGGTGRSYHADTACSNQARRVHYLLDPGWRADVAIQGLRRTHRTRQASAPLFRPVTTDVKGERRFIATIARRLDSLGAITRGQRDSQSSMGDSSLFRAEDNLESTHALSALRLMYLSIHNDHVPGWPEQRFAEATGLVLSDSEGGLKDSLPPMPRFLNRLLALPIDEQNDLFGHFQARVDAVIQTAKDAGVYNQGVEAIAADSLTVAARHPGPAGTEIVEIARRDALQPFTSDAALEAVRNARAHARTGNRPETSGLLVNGSSGRPAVALPAAVRGARRRLAGAPHPPAPAQRRVDPDRDAARPVPLGHRHGSALEGAVGRGGRRPAHPPRADVPSRHRHAAARLAPAAGRQPRIRRLATDGGERLIGRVLEPEEAVRLRRQADDSVAFDLPAEDVVRAVRERHARFHLANGWELVRRLVLGRVRVEIRGPRPGDIAGLKRLGAETEIVAWQTVVFADEPRVLERVGCEILFNASKRAKIGIRTPQVVQLASGDLAQGPAQGLAAGVGREEARRETDRTQPAGCEGARARGESGSPGARVAHRAHDPGRAGKSCRAGIEPRTRNALPMAAQPLAVRVGVAPACQALGRRGRPSTVVRGQLPGTSNPVQRPPGRCVSPSASRCSPARASSTVRRRRSWRRCSTKAATCAPSGRCIGSWVSNKSMRGNNTYLR